MSPRMHGHAGTLDRATLVWVCVLTVLTTGCTSITVASAQPAATQDSGRAEIALANKWLEARLNGGEGGLEFAGLHDRLNHERMSIGTDAFAIVLRSGRRIGSSEMAGDGAIRMEPLRGMGEGTPERLLGGQSARLTLHDSESGLEVAWHAVLHASWHYVRQMIALRATKADVEIERVVLFDGPAEGAEVVGTCPGSPIVAGNRFLAAEHPMGVSEAKDGRATCAVRRVLPLRKGTEASYSSVIGVARPGQMRRRFLSYIEGRRARPWQPFLHYNSWYDLGMFTPFNEKECVEVIETYGRELYDKHGVKIDSFLFDDGWDNYDSLWAFHAGFPNGFTPLKEAAAKIGAGPGVWLSPWGGYGKPRERRLAFGKKQGMEIDTQGYALSGPKYYARFEEVATEFVKRYGVNHFKFDGTGSPDKIYKGSAFDSDFDAAIHLIERLRRMRPELFINLTTGTWPSPFWLAYADSTWRGGMDHSFAGVGSQRQRWITYRDADTCRGVVRRGPLYPLNSLMLHGIIYAKHAQGLDSDPSNDFRDEVRSYFGSGTQLQEMYISPALLSRQNWDDLAEAAKWSRDNAETLVDTHWVGGDPGRLEVYGWASWSPKKGILVLRNPSDVPQAFSVDVTAIFELPDDAIRTLAARSPFKSDAGRQEHRFETGRSRVVELAPFEVLVLECVPTEAK